MDTLIDDILGGLFDVIYTVMELVLDSFIGRLMYYAETGLCKIVGMLDEMFRIFAGITTITYDGRADYLVNVFFTVRSVNNVYWGMALIGIAMVFGFAIAAVVRKMFDANGKMQTSLGQILTAALRSIILILSMSAIMIIVLNSTNILMQQINYVFNDADNLDIPITKTYTDEEYAAMGRVLNTIGNYSLNPSYSNRFNINTCFNEIRVDLYYLQQQNVFRYYYTTKDANGNVVNTWQSVLQKIANSHDLRGDLKLDVSYDAVTSSLVEAMDIIRNDASFRPLESYTRRAPAEGYLPLDRYLFLMGTMKAAKNTSYNENPELTDAVRGPYYSGEKNIYNIKQVSKDFDIGFATDYLIVFIAGIALIFDLVTIILNCIARIFNMLFLYIIAPPIFATQPFDGGGKTKQWLTAFIVQAFSVFGTVIAMRLLMIMLPIVISSKLVLFKNTTMDTMAKLVFVYGLFEVSKKATGLLTGILADSAGWQSVQAGDMSGSAGKMIGGVASAAKAVGGTALKATGKVADIATKPVQNLAKQGYNRTLGRAANWYSQLGSDVAGQEKGKAMAEAKHSIAVDDAKQQLLSGRNADGGGDKQNLPGSQSNSGSNDLPGSQSDSGSNDLPGNQSVSGNASEGSKLPPPPPPPNSPAGQLAIKSRQMHEAMSKKVDAQGNMKTASTGGLGAPPPADAGGASVGSRRLGGGFSSQGNREVGGVGARRTLGDQPTPPPMPNRPKEAPTTRNRPHL